MIFKKKEREEKDEEPTNLLKLCPLCGTKYEMGANYCIKDGQHLIVETPAVESASEESVTCKRCGFINQPPLKGFCLNCGERFEPKASETNAWIYPVGLYPLPIKSFPFDLGREQLCRLPGAEFVSSPHLRITLEGGDLYLTDMNSLNGTAINGHVMGIGHTHKRAKMKIYSKDVIGLAPDQKGRGLITLQFKVQDK